MALLVSMVLLRLGSTASSHTVASPAMDNRHPASMDSHLRASTDSRRPDNTASPRRVNTANNPHQDSTEEDTGSSRLRAGNIPVRVTRRVASPEYTRGYLRYSKQHA